MASVTGSRDQLDSHFNHRFINLCFNGHLVYLRDVLLV